MRIENDVDWLNYIKTKKPNFIQESDELWGDALEGCFEAMSNVDELPPSEELRSIILVGAIQFCQGFTRGKQNK